MTAIIIVSIVMFASVISRVFGGRRYGRRFRQEVATALPERDDGLRYGNSDPVTGQAAWYDLRVRIEKAAPGAELSEPQFDTLPLPPHLPKRPEILRYGAGFRTPSRGSGQ